MYRDVYVSFSAPISIYSLGDLDYYESGNDSVEYNNVNFDKEPDECTCLGPWTSHMQIERKPSVDTTVSDSIENRKLLYQSHLRRSRTAWQRNHYRKEYYDKRSQCSRSKYMGLRPLCQFAADLLQWAIDDEMNDPFDISHFSKYSFEGKNLQSPSTDPDEQFPQDEEFRVSTEPNETKFGIYARKIIAALKGSFFTELRSALYNSEIIPYLEYSFVCIVMSAAI